MLNHAFTRDSRTLTGKSGSVSCGVTSPLSWVLVCTRFCAIQKFVSPILWMFCSQIPLAFKFPGSSQSLCQISRLRNLLWATELLQHCKNFFGITFLQFVSPLLCGSMMGLMVTSSKSSYATCHAAEVCCSQRPCPCGRPLQTGASAGNTQTLKGRSGSVSCGVPGPVHTKLCLYPSSITGLYKV